MERNALWTFDIKSLDVVYSDFRHDCALSVKRLAFATQEAGLCIPMPFFGLQRYLVLSEIR